MGIPTNLAKAKQLAVYWDNYVNYLNTLDDKQPNIGNGTSKPPQTTLYVKPFGDVFPTALYIKTTGTSDRWDTYKTHFGTYTKETLVSGTESAIKPRGFRPARVVIKTGVSTTKSVVTAKTTKRKYITYGGTSGSVPFGQNGSSEETDAYDTIKAALVGAIGDNNTSVKLSRVKEVF